MYSLKLRSEICPSLFEIAFQLKIKHNLCKVNICDRLTLLQYTILVGYESSISLESQQISIGIYNQPIFTICLLTLHPIYSDLLINAFPQKISESVFDQEQKIFKHLGKNWKKSGPCFCDNTFRVENKGKTWLWWKWKW